ncbi:MAG: hemolysin III family protein [Desulfobacterales bacterium]|nr:hemolysin III family protein [Desulfobacterales bacterium]
MDRTITIKEPFNAFSHMVGALLSLVGLSILVTLSVKTATAWHVVSFSIYGTSLFLLYISSTVYHLIWINDKITSILKRLDHTMIFILIAGTYTPFCLIPLRGVWGWSLFSIIWGIAFTGIFLKWFRTGISRWVSTGIYLFMGWICLAAIYPLFKTVPIACLAWMAAGGLFYSIGAVIYGTKSPNPYPGVFGFHEIWHIFVMLGSFCHFWSIFGYLLYL